MYVQDDGVTDTDKAAIIQGVVTSVSHEFLRFRSTDRDTGDELTLMLASVIEGLHQGFFGWVNSREEEKNAQ